MPLHRRNILGVLAATLCLVTVCGACGGSSPAADGPAAPKEKGQKAAVERTTDVVVTMTADGCSAPLPRYPAGPLTFSITNKDATAVSEFEVLSGDRILGEKENLPPGFSGSFSLHLGAGTYTLYCPGAASDSSPLRVTGTSDEPADEGAHALLVEGTRHYAAYITAQSRLLIEAVRPLARALHGSDLGAAQDAYKRSRSYYEHIEPVAESFAIGNQNLDADIDARAGDVPAASWRGFHYIERGLFDTKSLEGLAPFGDRLLADVTKLHRLLRGLSYQPAELANGAMELLDEVAKSKITGEEERYSHIDLLDFSSNVEGAQQAFACLQPGLATIDSDLAKTISKAFAHLRSTLDRYRSTKDASGFVLYSALTGADKTQLSHALQAVAEPLSRVAGTVVRA